MKGPQINQPSLLRGDPRPPEKNKPRCKSAKRGMTLLEMTVVILVLLSLITVLFFGAQAWKRGSDRAICIIHIQNVQKGVRSFSNLYGYSPESNVPNLQTQVIGLGRFIETTPTCPGGGNYTFGQASGVNTIPPMGVLYMECSLSASDAHLPNVGSDW
jgi:prepilin-type N-terminal cleavage/methylation domain-containing protein